jgi:hypothetical protein
MRASRALWIACAIVAACGCSGPGVTFAPVEGALTRNGRPVPNAQVIFLADDTQGPRATGVTDDAGRFQLTADDGTVGAPVGRHRVCVIDATVTAERFGLVAKQHAPEAAAKLAPPKSTTKGPPIPPEYGRPAETPLRAEVRPGAQTIDLQIP